MSGRRAAFLDRDGTIIRDAAYLARPDDAELIPGAAAAVRRLNDAGIPVVVVSNQSGIGRGFFDVASFERVQERLAQLLAAEGARLDAVYMCPHAPAPDGSAACECRKPGTLLYRRAAAELGLDLAASWYVGDRLRDVQPALALGGRGVLVPAPSTPPSELDAAGAIALVSPTLGEAANRIIAG